MNGNLKILGVLLLFSLFFNVGCKKDVKKVTFSGTVLDAHSNAPIAGSEVTLAVKKIESGVYNSNFQNITTATTDGNGQFSIECNYEAVIAYRIHVGKNNYFDSSTEINSNDVQSGTNYSANYTISPEAFIKLHIKNNMPFDSLDLVTYSYKNPQPGCVDCCNNTIFHGNGMLFDTIFKCKTFGNTNNKVEWVVKKNGQTVLHSQDIFCIPLDTTTFEILY
jgi:hypothetical protein